MIIVNRILLMCLLAQFLMRTGYAQEDPEDSGIRIGAKVPPFFLATQDEVWQSSEHAFASGLTVLWFCDFARAPQSLPVFGEQLLTRAKIYIVDINPYESLDERRKAYSTINPSLSVLFDSKRYAAIAYGVYEFPAWFLVDENGVLIDFRRPGDVNALKSSIDKRN